MQPVLSSTDYAASSLSSASGAVPDIDQNCAFCAKSTKIGTCALIYNKFM